MARGKKKGSALTSEEKLVQALVPMEEQPYKVPKNWCWTKAGNMVTLYRGVSYKKNDAHTEKGENDCLIMRGGNISEGGIDTEADNVYVNKDLVTQEQLVKKHDIIIVSSTGSTKVIGRAGISLMDYDDVAFGAFLTLLRPVDYVSKSFVDYYFQSDLYRERIRSLASGVNINNIRTEYITESPVPLPPLAEQQRIVDRIEYLFAKLSEAKEKAQSVLDSFETRKAAILHKAFTGELTARWRAAHSLDIASWKNLYLKDICDYMKAGGDKPVDFVDEQDDVHCIPVVANGISNEGIIGYSAESKYDGETVTVSGRGTIGYSIYRNYSYYPVVRLIVLGPKKDVYAKFLKYAFDAFPEEGTGSSIPQLTVPMIKEKVIPVPCIEEQAEIVRIIDSLFVKEQQAKEATEAVLEKIDLLKKSILARAFRGELGTNDPTEESALELLKCIL